VKLRTQETLLGVAELEVLILELVAVDGLATSACQQRLNFESFIVRYEIERTVVVGEVTTLDHEVLDDTVEGRALVSEALLASGQSAEYR
jgi:hypothetical protein